MAEITDALTRLRAGCHEEVTRTGGVLDACEAWAAAFRHAADHDGIVVYD